MTQWLVRRGLLATVPVASLVLAFGACSSDTSTPTEQQSEPDATLGQEVSATPVARARIERLSQQFTQVPAKPPEAAPPQLRPGVVPPKAAPARPIAEPRPVVTNGETARFVQAAGRVRVEVDAALKRDTIRSASVELPNKASGFVRFQPDGASLGVEFATQGARDDVAIEIGDGTATYPGAAPDGGDIVFRITRDSAEDFVVLSKRPALPHVDYTVNVSEVAGLRLYDNTLEFLSADGDPQVRVRPPRVFDADSVTHVAKLALLDCAADTNGEAPWGRPVTAPGKSACHLRVSWDDTLVVYPAIVDPVWATAGSLATARYRNAAVRRSNGHVLTCGGIGDIGIALTSCESFNPTTNGGAGSWAAVTSMGTARSDFTMLSLSPASTDIVALGGSGIYTSERFNGTSWTASTGDFSAGYFNPQTAAVTADGAYVVMIDYTGTPYRLPTSTNTWGVGTMNPSPLHTYRYNASILTIPGQNTILRLGGYYSSTTFADGERYRPSTDSWATPGNAASMTVPREGPATGILDANRLIVYGGSTGAAYSSTAEIYNASANTWSFTTGALPNAGSAYVNYRGVVSAIHGSGKLVSTNDWSAYLFDPAAPSNPWSNIYTQGFNHLGSQANAITAGSRVLLVPVNPGGPSGHQTACRLFDLGEKGATCTATSECQTGLSCVQDAYDGTSTCCESACAGPCYTCRAAYKVSGTDEGVCGPRITTQDMYSGCPYSEASTCGNYSYKCDGVGECVKWPADTQCGNPSCVDGDTQNNPRLCDGAGTCLAQTQSNCGEGLKCEGSSCYTICYSDSYCKDDYYCDSWTAYPYTCKPKKANGSACGYTNSECESGYCIDGVCCDDACDGLCESCLSAQTGQTTGTCKPILPAAGYTGDCSDNGASSCGQNGNCNGAGACQLYASGTVCTAANCASGTSRNNNDTCNGSGVCTDGGVTTCATGYACVSGNCQTSCSTDSQCASGSYCDTAASQCVPDKPQGQACGRDAMCTGNANCVDGVCCDSSCTGSCRSCLKNRTGLPADGTCGNILDDTDPENECAIGAGYPQSCQAPGLCNGAGACRAYAKTGVECDTDECTDSTLTTYECNGAGTCKPKATQCYPFQCNTASNVCRVACTVATEAQDCVDGSSCDQVTATCVGQLPNGSACSRGQQCQTGFCANIGEGALEGDDTGAGGAGAGGAAGDPGEDAPGVCCDEACQGTCSGCKASIKGFGSDGICEFVKNNTDPANDCEPAAGDACGLDGQCNGGGACRLAPSGTACGATSCQGNSLIGQSCNGQGDCINNQGGVDCGGFKCRDIEGAFGCNSCTEDNHCSDGYYCQDGACSRKLANGKACELSGVCDSGYCVDGVCCDASCNGQCEACNSPGSEGVCGPVQGEPVGNRAKCDFAGEECGGSCDGVNAAACRYAATGTVCGETTCNNGLANSSACNGQGECRANPEAECSPYVCGDDDQCLTRCEIDADCSQGYACDETTQRCLPAVTAAECSEDRQSSVGSNGITTPCKPFLCVPASGTCAVSCAATTDCAPEFVCEASTKTCLPAPPEGDTGEEEGCACRAAGAPSRSSNHYLALLALGAALTGMRRRGRRHLSAE